MLLELKSSEMKNVVCALAIGKLPGSTHPGKQRMLFRRFQHVDVLHIGIYLDPSYKDLYI